MMYLSDYVAVYILLYLLAIVVYDWFLKGWFVTLLQKYNIIHKPKFKVGDKVRIVNSIYYGDLGKGTGTILIVGKDYSTIRHHTYAGSRTDWSFKNDELEVIRVKNIVGGELL